MIDLLISPLGPAILLLAAGVLLRGIPRIRRASLLALLTLLPLALSFLGLMWLRLAGVEPIEFTWWPLVTQALPVSWALDGWNWLAFFLLLLVAASAVLITWRLPGLRTGAFHGLSFLLVGAAAVSVVSGNLLALSAAWVATDILLIARTRGSRAQVGAAPVGLLAGSSLLVMLAIGITSMGVATTPLATARLPAETLALLLLAAALRMAVYPMHLWLGPGGVIPDRGTHWLVSGVAIVTGGWLLGRVLPLGAVTWLAHPLWPPLLAAAILAAGVAAWANSGQDRFAMLTSSRATWLWLTVFLAPGSLTLDTLGWALTAVILGMTLLVVGQATTHAWGWRLPLAFSAVTLAGAPLTVGLAARALTPAPDFFLWLLFVLGEGLILACVLAPWFSDQAAKSDATAEFVIPMSADARLNWPVIRLLLAFGLAAVPMLLWGLRPQGLVDLAGFSHSVSLGDLMGSMNFGQWLGIAFSLVVGAGLAWTLNQFGSGDLDVQRWRERLAGITSLSWALAGLSWAVGWLDTTWRTAVRIFEGEGYVGWLALLFVLAWLIIRA